MQRRILFVNNVGQIGGAEQSLLTLLGGLDQQQWQIRLVCPPASALGQRAQRLGITTIPLPLVDSAQRAPLRYLCVLWQFVQLARAWRPHLIHCNGVRSVLYGVPTGKILRIPTIVHIRDIELPPSPITKTLIKLADRQIAISHAVKATLQHLKVEQSCVVVYNGVNIGQFQPIAPEARAQFRARYGIPPDGLAIGIIGRILPRKGHEIFLNAAARLREHPQLYWLIIGEEWIHSAGFQQELITLANRLMITKRVHFTGWQDNIPAVLSALDIVTMPSKEPESFGRVVIEAMAAKRPVVASRIGGISEIIRDGHTGLLVPPGDAVALAKQIERLVSDATLYNTIVMQAWDAVQQFSHENHVKEIVKVYQSLW